MCDQLEVLPSDRQPDRVLATVEERDLEKPRSRRVVTEFSCLEIKLPLVTRVSELEPIIGGKR